MNGAQGGSLQNVLSISTAANNRYLLHFNSLHSLTQWTAGIRLAIFEHSTLQEAYTGSLIAGKGRYLNNIRQIMERSRFVHDDWARVRFGAGTPWKRCWCVISPPDEKEFAKAQKSLKKTSAYERAVLPKGNIKFYESRKITKKTKPIATVRDAYAAYAIYPQSKPLIDQSTLVKLEGLVTIHSGQETTTEGFVFVMPEVHAAVSGFEMMLRWLFPVYDTFGLYGRPTRLVADTLDQRGLMFAMPTDRRYGYLDTLDVASLIHTKGSANWSERQWRKEMKKLTSNRMAGHLDGSIRSSRRYSQRVGNSSRMSLPPTRSGVTFPQEPVIHSSPGSRTASPVRPPGGMAAPRRTDSAPPAASHMSPHKRSVSEVHGNRPHMAGIPSRMSQELARDGDEPPRPPLHNAALSRSHGAESMERIVGDNESGILYEQVAAEGAHSPPPAPVLTPPAFTHDARSRPHTQPYQAPELRRAHSNVDAATLEEMHEAVRSTDDHNVSYGQEELGLRPRENNYPQFHQRESASDAPNGLANLTIGERNGRPRDDRQRLSTIPASPFVPDIVNKEYFHAAPLAAPALNGVAEARERGSPERPELQQRHSGSSISRKPVPRLQPDAPPEAGNGTSRPGQASQVREMEPAAQNSALSDGGSFIDDGVIDTVALERILENDSRASTLASSATPDYASTASVFEHEQKSKAPIERPRAGKLKTVGDPDMQLAGRHDTYEKDLINQAAEIPVVDFGPTYAYKPSSRPGTSGTITPGDMDKRRSRSGDRLRQGSGDRLRNGSGDRLRASSKDRLSGYFGAGTSPAENRRQSYFGGRTTPGIEIDAPAESPGNRQSIVWTPGATPPVGTQTTRQSLTPEQWVQWRASAASQGQQAPARKNAAPRQRQGSSHSINRLSMSKTPPPLHARSPSGDWTQSGGPQRTPPSRPNSRGSGMYLNANGSGGLLGHNRSTSMSAKEQMQVARSTGTPLIDMAPTKKPVEAPEAGLVGAVAQREREKAASAHGLRSNTVQQAIALRQQQLFQQEAEAQAQAQWEMQQRYQQQLQADQYQQIAYQNSLLLQQQQQHAQMQYQAQVQAQSRAGSMYGIPQQGAPSMPRTSVYAPSVAGFGGQYVQQQNQPSPGTPYAPSQQGAPRR
jgi:CCR4-NOT transcriptional complex subunit CAF120